MNGDRREGTDEPLERYPSIFSQIDRSVLY